MSRGLRRAGTGRKGGGRSQYCLQAPFIALLLWLALSTALPVHADSSLWTAPGQGAWDASERTGAQADWRATTSRTNLASGRVMVRTNRFIQLGGGLNVTNATGALVGASPGLVLTADGAAGLHTAHQLTLPADIGSGSGVRIVQPGGQDMIFQPLALDYFDPSDGRSVLLDAVTNAVGWLVDSNEVVYSNCFTSIKASIRIRNTTAGVESDVLLHERPPSPGTFGLSAASRLEMLTEQLDGNIPSARWKILQYAIDPVAAATYLEPDLWDATLNFGRMKMITGRAFSNAREGGPLRLLPVAVGKSYLFIEGRRILVEAVNHQQVEDALLLLPEAGGLVTNAITGPTAGRQSAFLQRRLPGVEMAATDRIRALRHADTAAVRGNTPAGQPLLSTARSAGLRPGAVETGAHAGSETGAPPPALNRAGDDVAEARSAAAPVFVLDYQLVGESGLTNFTFRSDTTYFIADITDVHGVTRLEGGA